MFLRKELASLVLFFGLKGNSNSVVRTYRLKLNSNLSWSSSIVLWHCSYTEKYQLCGGS